MRVLQVVHDFVPETMAGAEISAYTLGVDLVRRHGCEVDVFCRGWDVSCEPYRERAEGLDGLRVRRVDFGVAGAPEKWRRHDERIEAAFADVLGATKPDVVHVHHLLFLSTRLVEIARAARVPVVVTLHDFWFRCPVGTLLYHDDTLCDRRPGPGCLSCLWPPLDGRKRRFLPWRAMNGAAQGLYAALGDAAPLPGAARAALASLSTWEAEWRAALLGADRIHSPSRFLKSRVVDFGIPAERVEVIPNGVPRGPGLGGEKRASAKLRLALIGLHRLKGLHVLVEALRQLPPDAVEVALYGAVGSPRYFERQMVGAAGLAVRYAGGFEPTALAEVFRDVDVLVVPSIWYENNPRVIYEAFATGTPVVTADIGGMAELVRDGVDGLLFRAGDAASLAAALARLAREPGLVERLRAGITAPSSTEECTDAILRLYDDARRAASASTRGSGSPA